MSDQAEKRVRRVVGVRQVLKALKEGKAEKVLLSLDAAPALREMVLSAAQTARVPVEGVAAMEELGRMCKVSVPSAACALLRAEPRQLPVSRDQN